MMVPVDVRILGEASNNVEQMTAKLSAKEHDKEGREPDEESESACEARPEVQESSSKDGLLMVSRKSRGRKARTGDNENKDVKEEGQMHTFVNTPSKTVVLEVKMSFGRKVLRESDVMKVCGVVNECALVLW